jgi:hypothetical protein
VLNWIVQAAPLDAVNAITNCCALMPVTVTLPGPGAPWGPKLPNSSWEMAGETAADDNRISVTNLMYNVSMEEICISLDLSPLLPPYVCEYAILCDRPLEFINEFAAAHPKCFVFPFLTLSVDEIHDYNGLVGDHIVQPYYVGNLHPVGHAIRQIMKIFLEREHFLPIDGLPLPPPSVDKCIMNDMPEE